MAEYNIVEENILLALGPTKVFSNEDPLVFPTLDELSRFMESFIVEVFDELGIQDFNDTEALGFQFILRAADESRNVVFLATKVVFTTLRFFETIQSIIRSIQVFEEEGVWIADGGVESGEVTEVFTLEAGDGHPIFAILKVIFADRNTIEEII